MTPSTTTKPTATDEANSDTNTAGHKPLRELLTRDVAICVAASTMAPSASSTSHHVWYSNRYMSTKPAARSCTNVRTDDTTMRLVCPSSSFHDTSPATSMRGARREQLHIADVHHAAVHARRTPSAGEASAAAGAPSGAESRPRAA